MAAHRGYPAGHDRQPSGSYDPHNPHAPIRPARSVRRPTEQLAASSSASPSSRSGGPGPSRARLLAEAIQRDEDVSTGRSLRPGSALSQRSGSPSGDERDDSFQGDLHTNHSAAKTSPVLAKAVQAFASGGRDKSSQGARQRHANNAGPSAGSSETGSGANTPGGRGRRGAVGVQGESSRMRGAQNQQAALPSTPAFREMERVLAQVVDDWPELLPPSSAALAGGASPEDAEDEEAAFDPVTLALSLVDSQADPGRMRSFLATKEALSRSLKSSILTHYRSFDASVSSYNGLLSNLSFAQKNTSNLRLVLEEVRETLGKGRTELGVLQARRTELAEMDKILNSVEILKAVPDKLEMLMSEKKFLMAAGLLMRSLKMVSRGDMLEINAVADLRAYFVSQEALMLEYLTEELHNHLYLKSIYTDARWKAHAPGQTDLPTFFVDTAPPSIFDVEAKSSSSDNAGKPTKLAQFLSYLSTKPSEGPNVDEALDESKGNMLSSLTNGSTVNAGHNIGGIPASASINSLAGQMEATSGNTNISPSASMNAGLGIAASGSSVHMQNGVGSNGAGNNGNAEQDSFSYIENIVESLAYLGKLSFAMDSVLQRAPIEIYNLVESTVVEVDERNDPVRRSSMRIARLGISPKLLYSGTFGSGGSHQSSAAYSLLVRSSLTSSMYNNDEANLASLYEMNTEILMDFFWTMFSKFDAVLQGFRVLLEIVSKIATRKGLKDTALTNKAGGLMYSLNDIWRPIQFEIQALLHDYLVDDSQGNSASSRSPIASINETLRQGRPVRDPNKAHFKFSDTGSSTSRRLKPFEDSLNKSLKNSVPGLVSSLAEGTPATFSTASSSALLSIASNDTKTDASKRNVIVGRTHRMLVPPNAFMLESLILPTMKFLDRAKATLPEGFVNSSPSLQGGPDSGSARYSGIMDEETLEKLKPALAELGFHKTNQ